jgi:AraC family transcriptional regulator
MSAQTQALGTGSSTASEFFHGNISISISSRRMVARLLATATSTLEADRLTARTCIQRAADLLGVDLNQTSSGPRSRVCLPRGGLAPWQAELVKRYVREHSSSSIRTGTLAQMVRLSQSHFYRAFRCSFGETPRLYVARWRVQRGQQLMLNSQLSLARIAVEIGMCDQAHFCRTFRRVVGINPNAWRRANSIGVAPSTHGADDTADLNEVAKQLHQLPAPGPSGDLI